MPVPAELQRTVTVSASMHSYMLGYAMGTYTLHPWEDTVKIKRGGPYAYPVYDELLRDGRVFGAFRKRLKETTSRNWMVEPASDDRTDTRAAEIVEAQLKTLPYGAYQKHKMTALMKGLSIGEILFREPASRKERDRLGSVVAGGVAFRKPWHFRFVYNKETERTHIHFVGPGFLGTAGPGSGLDLDSNHPRKFIRYSWGSQYGDPYGKGLGHQLYWPVFFKRQDWKLWLFYADKFAMPTVDVAFDPEAVDPNTEEGKASIEEAEKAAKKIRTEGVLVHSSAFVYKLLEAMRRGDVKTYTEGIDYCDREIVIALLGSTLAVDLKGEGARAAVETHAGDIRQLAEDDAEEVCADDTKTLVRWISELNVPDATPPTVKRIFPDTTDYHAKSQTDKAVMEAVGMGLSPDYAEKTYGIEIDRERLVRGTTDETDKESDADAE